ncbi:MAG TPA: hypothetical protein VE031_09320 [Chthoniobacterales bacterium]|nr:hypothetical protein [Chthoniobacterales bacterium]
MSPRIIHTAGDGVLKGTSPEQVNEIAKEVARATHTVIHLHGGLVTSKSAIDAAGRLSKFYQEEGLQSVFFVWESGLFETISNNPNEIFNEKIFRTLLKRVLKWAGGKILDAGGSRNIGDTAEPLDDGTVEMALDQADLAGVGRTDSARQEPLLQLVAPPDIAPLKSEEQEKFARELRESQEFRDAFDGLMLGLAVEPSPGRRAASAAVPFKSLISQPIKDELRETAVEGQRGLFDAATMIGHAVAVLVRVVRRLAQHRDHGLYTTVVEELLRELYVNAIGTHVWGMMKKDTQDTFEIGDPAQPRGGRLFVAELAAAVGESGKQPRISIVAHSAGAIFTSHLLKHVDQQRKAGALPADFHFHGIAFLAPACRCALWADVLAIHRTKPLWNSFRMFSLSDPLESGYWELPPLYPRSLLYIISGILENPEFDTPLLGMQRYLKKGGAAAYDKMKEVVTTRDFLAGNHYQVWSQANDGPGLSSDSTRHGAFTATGTEHTETMKSVSHFLTT